MTYIFNGALTCLSYGIIFFALLYLLVGLFGIEKKATVKNTIIWILIAMVPLYWMHFYGEYRPWLLNRDTKERLLALSITDGTKQKIAVKEMDLGEIVYGAITVDDETVEYYENWSYYYSYLKIFEKKLYDDDSFVLIMPRESDRTFEQIPPISEYRNTVVIITDAHSLEISFWERKNSSKTLNEILDELEEMEIIAFE